MNTPPPSQPWTDPNARLLASVLPPPLLPLGTRVWQLVQRVGQNETRRGIRWLSSREPWQRWAVAGLGSALLVFGLYQSASSAGSESANVAEQAPRIELLALTRVVTAKAPDPAAEQQAPPVAARDAVVSPPPTLAEAQPPERVAPTKSKRVRRASARASVRSALPRARNLGTAVKKKAKSRARPRSARASRRSQKL
jgi:hypothetical protein